MFAPAALRCARRSGRLVQACQAQLVFQTPVPASPVNSLLISRHKSTPKKKGPKKTHVEKTSDLDNILDVLDDDDDIEGPDRHVDVPDTPVAAFISQGGKTSQQQKSKVYSSGFFLGVFPGMGRG